MNKIELLLNRRTQLKASKSENDIEELNVIEDKLAELCAEKNANFILENTKGLKNEVCVVCRQRKSRHLKSRQYKRLQHKSRHIIKRLH